MAQNFDIVPWGLSHAHQNACIRECTCEGKTCLTSELRNSHALALSVRHHVAKHFVPNYHAPQNISRPTERKVVVVNNQR